MPIFIDGIDQGGDDWKKLRLGIPTASRFEEIVTTKGERIAGYVRYLLYLVALIIVGNYDGVSPLLQFRYLLLQRLVIFYVILL